MYTGCARWKLLPSATRCSRHIYMRIHTGCIAVTHVYIYVLGGRRQQLPSITHHAFTYIHVHVHVHVHVYIHTNVSDVQSARVQPQTCTLQHAWARRSLVAPALRAVRASVRSCTKSYESSAASSTQLGSPLGTCRSCFSAAVNLGVRPLFFGASEPANSGGFWSAAVMIAGGVSAGSSPHPPCVLPRDVMTLGGFTSRRTTAPHDARQNAL